MVTVLAILYGSTLPDKYESGFNVYYNSLNQTDIGIDNAVRYTQPDIAYWKETMVSNKVFELVGEYSGLPYGPEKFRSIFTVESNKEENLFGIKMKVDSPEVIPNLAGAYVRAINTIDSQNQSAHFINKIKYLNSESINIRNAIDSCDLKIMRLSSQLNLQNIESVEQLTNIRESFKQSMKTTEVELSYVKASKQKTENELANLNDTLFERSSFTEPLKVQLMNLHVDQAQAMTKYGEAHPVVMGIRENITHVEEMLTDGFEQNIVIKDITANPIKRTLLGQLINLKIQEISLEAKIKSLQNIINSTNTTDTPNQELYQLLRNRETQLGNSDFLNKKIIDLEMSMKGVSSSFYLIDLPIAPENPSSKGMKMYLLMGIMGGLCAAIGLIIVYDLIDDRIKLTDDFSRYFSINILGAVRHRSGKDLLTHIRKLPTEEIYSDFENELTDIRVNLKQLLGTEKNKLFSLISPVRQDGKSLLLYLLALEYSKAGKRVLVMDFDIYVPKLSEHFEVSKDAGVQDFLLSDAPLDKLLQKTDIPGIDILPVGANPYKVKLLFDTEKVDELFKQVREKYDIVFVDTPALLLAPEVIGLISRIDVNILITRIGHTARKNIDLVLEKLKNIPNPIIGTILTDVKPVPLGTYYDKYKKYGKYYAYEKQKQYPVTSGKKRSKKIIITSLISLVAIAVILLSLIYLLPKKVEAQGLHEVIEIDPSTSSQVIASDSVSENKQKMENSIPESSVIGQEIDEIIPDSTLISITDRPYYIIAGCFSRKENAENLVMSLKSKGYTEAEQIGKVNGLFTVIIGKNTSKEKSIQKMEQEMENFSKGLWIYRLPSK
jgi:polysaccharide biosynthesis transport protein